MIEQDNEKNILAMKLVHYFITKEDYIPIIIKGVDNEIWLENKKGEFRIIRIVTKNIFNEEQYNFDNFKIKNVTSQIMKQTFNPFMDVLTIYINSEDRVKDSISTNKKYKSVFIDDEKEIFNNELLNKYYKNLKDNIYFEEEGYNLLAKITTEISNKNMEDSKRLNDMYNKKKPIITYSLIAINIIVFILMYVLGNGSENTGTLINFGANFKPYILKGEYYRLITSAFLHVGILHLFCNMYSLYVLGPTLEHFFGKVKFIIIYIYSAILGSLFTMIFQGSNSISAGASGAIFGLLGALLYFGYNYRGYIGNRIINQILPIIVLNLFIGFVGTGISNSAHIGGLIGGVSMAFALGTGEPEGKSKRINGTIITIILTAFIIYMAFFK